MINTYLVLVLGFLGLSVGSFLSAYTYRTVHEKSVKKGRSFCDHCKSTINWFDNIPLLSYLFLGGKCRHCGKKISIRYPLIELSTAIMFVSTYMIVNNCATSIQGVTFKGEIICTYADSLGVFAIPFFLLILSLLLAIFVIDFENQIIPDELVFSAIVVILFVKILASQTVLYVNLLTAFSAAVFLLGINLATRGKGMGLGDVKLALLGGLLLSWPVTATWLYLSFIIGAITGIVLILAKKAKFGKQIAFGPFLIISLFISLATGYRISELLFAFLP